MCFYELLQRSKHSLLMLLVHFSGQVLRVARMTVEIKFSHRCNRSGTWQSICPECYKMVAESREESDLKYAEDTHVCLSLNARIVRIA